MVSIYHDSKLQLVIKFNINLFNAACCKEVVIKKIQYLINIMFFNHNLFIYRGLKL